MIQNLNIKHKINTWFCICYFCILKDEQPGILHFLYLDPFNYANINLLS